MTIVDLPKIRLIVCRAEADRPDEIKAAWQKLESKLSTLKGRKFYGLSVEEPSGWVYYAGLEPLGPEEEATLRFPPFILHGGRYARTKLMGWPKHTEQIPAIFDRLEKSGVRDPSRPNIEFYRSQSELHLLVPVHEVRA